MKTNKNSNFLNIIKAASVYTGIVLGAGFASGQEIIKFFVQYGSKGILGLFLSGIVFAISGWAVMDICVRLGIKKHTHFISTIFGKKLGTFIEYATSFFIFILFCAMLAGTGAMVEQAFNINFTIGVLSISVLCFIVFLFDMKGIIQINLILAPILVIGGVFFGLYSFFTEYTPVFLNESTALKTILSSWAFAALNYSSYNIITAISVLSEMHDVVTNRKIAKYAGLLGGLCLTILGICFALPLFINQGALLHMEIPMLYIAKKHGFFIELLYIFILLAAIFTTAVSNGFAIVEWLSSKLKVNKLILKIVVITTCAVFAHIGFSNFVGKIYPIFGYIGLFEVIAIIIYFLFGKKTND